jgi:2-dehydropantoate 2-reductase
MARVLVVGAGALGSLLGALLQEARHDVVLLARGAHAREVALEGLLLTGGAYGPPRRVPLKAAFAAPPAFAPDLAILAVKTPDVEAALKEHHAAHDGAAPIVALQNGLAQDALVAQAAGPARAVGAVAALDAEFLEPGHVDCARRGTLVLGGPDPATTRAAEILGRAVRVRRTGNLPGARWTKLLVNLGNVVPAITGLSYQEAARHPGLARAHVRMIREGVAVSRAEGVDLAPLPWASPGLLRLTARAPDALAARVYAMRVRRVMGRRPGYGSTWQSVQRGKSPETTWLNGEVVRRGRARGVPTPVNEAAAQLVEAGKRLAPGEAARALLAQLG